MTPPVHLLRTKLFPPRTSGGLVDRARLRTRLDPRHLPALLVASAPAGFGKSTFLAQSLLGGGPGDGPAVAWLSLDAGDSDPASYWAYVLAALRTAAPALGRDAQGLLESPGGVPITQVLTSLLNDLAASDQDVVLVLDDYHVIHDPDIHEAMSFLLEHLPPQLHLVIATRSDPPLPLARLRARGELAEVRATDLRFTDEETAAYLGGMGLRLSSDEITTLERRTEGWVAALQLAALSLQGRDDATRFIAGFAGDDRHVVDYLVEEVVRRQSDDIRDFLLRTSVLERMSGPLTDAVTGGTEGRGILERLDRDNLFVVPLDDQRRWYRYHHLFADMLQARLLDERPDEVAELHRRASAWFEGEGDTTAAVEHALAGGDTDRAAELVELDIRASGRDRREAQQRRWMEALPESAFTDRPVLAMGYVGALMSTGETRGVEPRLRIAERWVEAIRKEPDGRLPEGLVVADPTELRRLPGTVAVHRCGLALMAGDHESAMRLGREALADLEPDDHLNKAAATALMGITAWGQGDLGAAEAAYAESMRQLELAGHVADVLGCAITLADLQAAQGRLRDAERTYRDCLDLAARQPGGPLRGAPDMHVGLSMLEAEHGDHAAAAEHLRIAHELGDHLGMPRYPHRWRIAEAGVREARGDVEDALALLDEAEQVYDGDFSPDVRPVAAMRARVWLRHGRSDRAAGWAADRGLSVTDEPTYLREYEHLTLARVLLDRRDAAVVGLLDGLLGAAGDAGRLGSVLEIQLLRAVALQQRGDLEAALAALARAVELGEQEGYVRTFTDEGVPVATLLSTAAARGASSAYVDRLVRASGGAAVVPSGSTGGLVDPLSERELDVLRLLATELSGPEIARHLVVSLNTVRTHTKSIYAKLGVGTRRAAVRRAEELRLLHR